MDDALEQSVFGDEPLPLILSPRRRTGHGAFLELLRDQRGALKQQLLQHGALLFWGWPVESAQEFAAAIEALGTGSSVNYIGGDSPRRKITGAVYTSTEAPSAVKIPLHNEMSFVRSSPKP